MTSQTLDLGLGHYLRFTDWDPDLKLHPDLAMFASQFPARVAAIVSHSKPDGVMCEGAIHFDCPLTRKFFSKRSSWVVVCWEPMTLTPSLLCHCGDHGSIRDGKWVRALCTMMTIGLSPGPA